MTLITPVTPVTPVTPLTPVTPMTPITLIPSASALNPFALTAMTETITTTEVKTHTQGAEVTRISETTEVIVCTTCRPAGASRDLPAAGAALFDAVQIAQLQDDAGAFAHVRVRGVECLNSCSRACSVAFQAPGKHTYLFGDLVPDDETAEHVLLCAAQHARASDGTLVRNDRPARLRSGILAKLPPFMQGPGA